MGTDVLPQEVLVGMSSAELQAVRALFGAGPVRRVHRYDAVRPYREREARSAGRARCGVL
jgi:hypothetical protein